MPVIMVGAVAGSNVLVALDDPSVWTDEGVAYPAFAVTNPINFGRTNPRGKLRRIGQAVTIGGQATVTLTPFADGDEYDDQAVSRAVVASGGSTQIVKAEPAVEGQRLGYKFAASAFDGPVEFGEADLELIPKRSS